MDVLRFKSILSEKGISQEYLARVLKINRCTLYRKLSDGGKEIAVSGFYGYAPVLKNADEIAWEINHRHFKIEDMGGFVAALSKAKAQNSPLYWGYYKLVNGE